MVKVVLIARKSDGLIFCEVAEDDKNIAQVRSRAIEFLKNMQSKQDLCTVNIDSQNFVFHYKINENVVYLVITDVKYPSKLAFCFLEDIDREFQEHLKSQFGTQSVNYYSKLETVDRAYYFIKFEKVLKKKKSEYADSGNKSNIDRLNRELADVHKIITENVSLILDREKALDTASRIADTIKEDSKKFKKQAYETRMKMLLAKYSVFIAIGGIIILFILFKYYL
jgi:vesicle transport protein SEC22